MSAHNRFKIQAACVRYNDSCMSASERATSTFVSLCDSDRSPIGFILGSDFLLFEKKNRMAFMLYLIELVLFNDLLK